MKRCSGHCCNEAEIRDDEHGGRPRRRNPADLLFLLRVFPGLWSSMPRPARNCSGCLIPWIRRVPSRESRTPAAMARRWAFTAGDQPDGKNYWVMQGSFVYRYELPSLKPPRRRSPALIDQAGKPFKPPIEGSWLTISPDGRKVYAVRPGRNLLSIIDVQTMKEEALIQRASIRCIFPSGPRGTP